MLKVALTGGIATGKSHVLARMRQRGIPTIDADDVVHAAFGTGTSTTRAIANEFGPAVLQPDGSVNRGILGEKVFTDGDARARLEAIVHPMVYETIRDWFARGEWPIGVASIPLLYETHRARDFDLVVVTACTPEQQLDRLLRRGLPEADARARLAAQMPTLDKVMLADYVIRTIGTPAETDKEVDELVDKLTHRASRPSTVDGRQS